MKYLYDFFTMPFKIVPCKKGPVLVEFLSSFFGGLVALLIPYFGSEIIHYLTLNNATGAYRSLLFLAISYFISMVLWWCNYHSYSINDMHLTDGLYERFMNKICDLNDKYSDEITAGKILNMLNSDAVQIPYYIDDIFEIINTMFMCIFLSIILFLIDYRFSLIAIIIGIFYLFYVNHYNKKANVIYENRKKEEDRFSNLFMGFLNGMSEIRTMDMHDGLYEKVNIEKKKVQKMNVKYGKYRERYKNTSFIWINIGKAILYFGAILFIMDGKLDIATMVLVVSYYETLVSEMSGFVDSLDDARVSQVSIRRMKTILDLPTTDTRRFGHIDNELVYGNILFDHVSFQYDNHIILNDANIKITPNTINCIVGESGCGKSSVMQLLLRLKSADMGAIYLDGKNLEDYSKEILSSSITAVSQKPFLYHMTIRENFSLIDSDITHQIDVCKRVGIHDFIMSLPKGYNTVLHENAANVSGGQRQLLSIARVLLTKAEILIFDEITSSLDPTLVLKIAKLVEDLKQDHTIIMITNKEEIMKISDQILLLENGRMHSYQNIEQLHKKEIKIDSEMVVC